MENLSAVLKHRRRELGLTLAQIASQMGVAEATVQRWESGNIKSIRYDKISKLAEVLQVNPASFMDWSGVIDNLPSGDSLEKLNGIPGKENPPSTTEAAPGEGIISMEKSNKLLEALGLIEEGRELSDDDLAFLTHVIGLLDAWFGKGE